MIIDKIIKVHIIPPTFKWYLNKGYGPFKVGDTIDVKVEDLTYGSGIKIKAMCDFCGKIRNMKYNDYNKNISHSEEHIYSCVDCKMKKTVITNLKKYGVKYVLQNKEMIEKSKQTILKNWGVENVSQSEEIKNKKIETTLKNWGVEYPQSNETIRNKTKQTLLEEYGVDNASKSDEIKEKKKKTCLKNWGVENPSQSEELFNKSQKNGKRIKFHKKSKLWYRGSYELDFLIFCCKNKIIVQKGPTISYIINEKNSFYHSDFYLPEYNLICEIKSNYYYEKYLEKNLLKEKYTKNNGYNFTFIINENYDDLRKLIKV